MSNCENCNKSKATRSIFVSTEESEKGLSPSEVNFEAEEETSYTICEECYFDEDYMI